MDVLCVGMYRACSTWQYDVVAHLVERHRGGRRLGYLTGEEYAELERAEPAGRAWRVLKSHEEHPRFAAALREGDAIAVYAYRDVRDVVYSMLDKRGVSFDDFLRQGMIHQVLANDRFWTRQPRQITQRYESIMDEPARAIAELAAHLEISLDANEAEQIAEEYSLEANRRRTRAMASRLAASGLDLSDPSNLQRADETTLLHWNHVRSGRSGEWRDRATPAERRVLARVAGPWLARHGYEPDTPPRPPSGWSARWGDTLGLARGWLACRLRCAALRHPALAGRVKRALGIPTPPRPHRCPPTPHLPAMEVVPLAGGSVEDRRR